MGYYANTINLGLKASKKYASGKELETQRKESLEEPDPDQVEGEKLKFDIKMFKGYRAWELTPVEIIGFKVVSKARSSINIDLRNYLLRNSKKKDKKCYVLEAIKNEDPESVRFAFTN